jgi:hypothetical protein
MVHNRSMSLSIQGTVFLLWLTVATGLPTALAQDPAPVEEADDSSQQVEESDEEFRRRMELEDARARDLGFPAPTASPAKDLEKIDKLPEKSQDNIRDQLVDVIVESGEWEPFDALREYPYEATAAAQADPDLLQKEQEAWDEQIQKYHEREAAAYGAQRGPVPGPGNPTGQEGGAQESAGQEGGGQEAADTGGEQGAGAGSGGQGDEQGGGQAGSSGTYRPYESNRSPTTDEVSTAGAQQSALDFLRGQQGQAQPAATATSAATPAAATPAATSPATGAAAAQASAGEPESASEPATESALEAEPEVLLDTRGIIPIEDLDKLEGTELPPEPEQPAAPAAASENDGTKLP